MKFTKTGLASFATLLFSTSVFAGPTKIICRGTSTTDNSVLVVLDMSKDSSPTGIGFAFSVDQGGMSYGNINQSTLDGSDKILTGNFGFSIRIHKDNSADAVLPNTGEHGPSRISAKLQCKNSK